MTHPLRLAVQVMERADNLHMPSYQGKQNREYCETTEELHKCGNTACFAGYLSLSPEFKAMGLYSSYDGVPAIGERVAKTHGASAIAIVLHITLDEANRLVHGDTNYYPVPFAEVKPHHVITKLEELIRKYDA